MDMTPSAQWNRRMTAGSQDNVPGRPTIMRDNSMASPVNARNDMRSGMVLNAMNWQATGVINNLPPRGAEEAAEGSRYGLRYEPTVAQMQANGLPREATRANNEQNRWMEMQEERDSGKAADLALREVLGSLEAARYTLFQCCCFGDMLTFNCSDPASCKPSFSTLIFAA